MSKWAFAEDRRPGSPLCKLIRMSGVSWRLSRVIIQLLENSEQAAEVSIKQSVDNTRASRQHWHTAAGLRAGAGNGGSGKISHSQHTCSWQYAPYSGRNDLLVIMFFILGRRIRILAERGPMLRTADTSPSHWLFTLISNPKILPATSPLENCPHWFSGTNNYLRQWKTPSLILDGLLVINQ